jgi:hypothetical protein
VLRAGGLYLGVIERELGTRDGRAVGLGVIDRCVERGALYEGAVRCCHPRFGVAERRPEGVTNREVADGPGLRVMFTLGAERL